MPVRLALRKLRQGDCHVLKASLGYTVMKGHQGLQKKRMEGEGEEGMKTVVWSLRVLDLHSWSPTW